MLWKVNKPKFVLDFHPKGLWTQIERGEIEILTQNKNQQECQILLRTSWNCWANANCRCKFLSSSSPFLALASNHFQLFWCWFDGAFERGNLARTIESFKLKFYIQIEWNCLLNHQRSHHVFALVSFNRTLSSSAFIDLAYAARWLESSISPWMVHSRLQIELWNLWYDELLYMCV